MGLIAALERRINGSSLYNPLRFGVLPNTVFEWLTRKTARTIMFYRSFLPSAMQGKAEMVFDIGANKGNKTAAFLRMGYQVLAVDPERKSIGTIRYRFGAHPCVSILEAGIGASRGELTLRVFDYRSGYNTLSDKGAAEQYAGKDATDTPIETYSVPVVTLDDLIAEHGMPVYVKIDVEGFEQAVIEGLSQTVPCLSFEANLPQFRSETSAILRRLATLDAAIRFQVAQDELLQSPGKWLTPVEAGEWLARAAQGTYEIIALSAKAGGKAI